MPGGGDRAHSSSLNFPINLEIFNLFYTCENERRGKSLCLAAADRALDGNLFIFQLDAT